MKPVGNTFGQKTFNFQHEKKEACDADVCMDFLIQGNLDDFRAYVNRYPTVVNMKEGQHGNVPLHVASSRGDLGLINFLLQNHADVNVQDIFGNAPIHYATDKSKKSAVEILISNGANNNLQDYRGNAPLHLACANNDIDMVKLLLKLNADPEITDLNDLKPGDRTNSPMIKILLDRRINSIRTGEADTAQQSVQWMSFGVGLGVGLGVALAKYQQTMLEQQLKAQMEASKPKRRGNFASVANKSEPNEEPDGGGTMVRYSNSLTPAQQSHMGQSQSHVGEQPSSSSNNRKFL